MRVGALLLPALLLGCVTTPRPPPVQEFTLRLSPAALGRELQLMQRISMVRGDLRRSFEAQLEIDASEVRVAALALGQTIATLRWDGQKFEQKVSTYVPEVVTAERIITDIQLAWWPEQVVREGLPSGFSLLTDGGVRELRFDGAPFASVHYEGTAPAWSRVILSHHRYGYTLEIESVEAAP